MERPGPPAPAAAGFTPKQTPVASVASVLAHIGEVDPQELTHPRHYNLRWMQILTEVHDLQRHYDRVFKSRVSGWSLASGSSGMFCTRKKFPNNNLSTM